MKNTFQQVAEKTHGIITPANAISAAGFILSMRGTRKPHTWKGIAQTGAGFMLDVADGKVARATGTSSPVGEAVDATLDKIKTGYFAFQMLREKRAPKSLVGAVLVQNAVNAAITSYDRNHNDTPQVHPSKAGKYGMFAQNSGLGLHAVGSKLQETHWVTGAAVKDLGSVIGFIGVALSFAASYEYAQTAGLLPK